MKQKLTSIKKLVTCFGLLIGTAASAQVASYTFAQTAGTYTTSAGTTLASAALGNMDEEVFGPITMPAFAFDGTIYTSVYINTNGYITFGAPSETFFYDAISGTQVYAGSVAAFCTDLDQASSGTRNIRYQTIGSEFVIQWQNVARYSVTGERISFQIRLNNATNQIKVIYGGTITPGNDTGYPEVGLRGPDNTFGTNVNNRRVNAGTGAWLNSVPGTANTSTCYFNSATAGTVPAVGTTFTWTPPAVNLTAEKLVAPLLNACFGRTETVSATIRNVGGATINFATTPLTLNATATGPNPVTFAPVVINTGTLAVNATITVPISTAYNMSVSGSYAFDYTATITGDAQVANNHSTDTRISHTPTVTYANATACSGQNTTLAGTAVAHDYPAAFTNTTPLAIPDDVPAGANSTLVISGMGLTPASAVLPAINNLTHTYDADLIIKLTAPDGSSVILSNMEGSDANFIGTQFSDAATTPISASDSPFTGLFNPESPLSGLTGSANGTWTLNIADIAAADVGTLSSWTLAFNVTNSISTYSWSPATGLSSATVAAPVANTTASALYIVTVTDVGGCTNTDSVQLTINALPTVTAAATPAAVCSGSAATVNGSGAVTYAWTGGITNGTAFTPLATDTYTVTGTDGNGCINTATATVTVNALPTVAANTTATAVCDGDAVTFTGSGATSYTWSGGVTDGTAFTPSLTDTYTVTGTDGNGCMNTATAIVTVNALPTVAANASAAAVCDGADVTLTGSGATTYTWSGTVTDGTPFTPLATDTYTVTGTDGNGCMNSATTTVTVNALPTVTADASAAVVCEGSNVTFTGNGAASYTWSGGVTDGTAFTPSATDTYTVTGTDVNGCMNTATTTVTVNALPTVTANTSAPEVCENTDVTFTGGGAISYTWSSGVTDGTPFTPSATDTYTVTGTDGNGCMNTATAMVTVNPLPAVDLTLATTTVCIGSSPLTLSAGSPAGGSWSGNGVTAGTFDPAAAGAGASVITYMYTDANGCANSDTASITVDLCTGIAEAANGMQLNAYPNPANDVVTLTISNAGAEEVQVVMVNVLGKEVYNRQINSSGSELTTQINVADLAKGTYLLKVTTGSTLKVMKIVKQ